MPLGQPLSTLIPVQPISADEDAAVVKRMKLGEATGPDDLPAEVCNSAGIRFNGKHISSARPSRRCHLSTGAGQHDGSNLKAERRPG